MAVSSADLGSQASEIDRIDLKFEVLKVHKCVNLQAVLLGFSIIRKLLLEGLYDLELQHHHIIIIRIIKKLNPRVII